MSLREVAFVSHKLNSIIDSYLADNNIIFDLENERKGLLFESVAEQLRSWKKQRTCIFEGCKAKSIRRSHTIQRSGPLDVISENSCVLTPRFLQKP
jgi:hypothetical protein